MGCASSKTTGLARTKSTSSVNPEEFLASGQQEIDLVTSPVTTEDFNQTIHDQPLTSPDLQSPQTTGGESSSGNDSGVNSQSDIEQQPPIKKKKMGKRLSVDAKHEQRMLLENWQKPTEHMAHKKIMNKVPGSSPNGSPPVPRGKKRVSDAGHPEFPTIPDDVEVEADSSEDESPNNFDEQKNRIDNLPPGSVTQEPSILSLFRPKTPLVLDLD